MSRGTLGAVALAVLALSGCSAPATPTVSAADFESVAAGPLSEQWDSVAAIQCGREDIAVVEGTTVDCIAHNPNSALDYRTAVTITSVKGSKYTVDVVVGDVITDDDTSGAPTVPGANLAELASSALEPKLGYKPLVDCGTEPVAIVLDGTIDCVATGSDGVDYPATITVTEVTETGYDIDVVMGADPVG